MSPLLVLPTPLAPTSITLGQLITNPLHAESASLKPASSPAQQENTTLDKPAAVFNTLRRDSTTRSFLCKMAAQHKPVYFVTGVQTLKSSTSKRAVVQHEFVAEATAPQSRLPVRRVDSASSLEKTTDGESTESILAVKLLKVKCRVGPSSAPHCISDLDYSWSYHTLEEEDLQLSIGLGKAVESSELKALAGLGAEEENSETNWNSNSEASEDGLGGF